MSLKFSRANECDNGLTMTDNGCRVELIEVKQVTTKKGDEKILFKVVGDDGRQAVAFVNPPKDGRVHEMSRLFKLAKVVGKGDIGCRNCAVD